MTLFNTDSDKVITCQNVHITSTLGLNKTQYYPLVGRNTTLRIMVSISYLVNCFKVLVLSQIYDLQHQKVKQENTVFKLLNIL